MGEKSLMQSAPGPETVIDGHSYLYFGGTSYLGLAAHPAVIEAGCDALRRYGVHSATSRSRLGNIPPVLDVESKAAEFFGTDAAFYFGSGYMSNHILVSALGPATDAILVDSSSHYCVLEAAGLAGVPVITFEPRDVEDLLRKRSGYSNVLVMADAVGASSGEMAPVEDYIAGLKGIGHSTILLDDAHGFGVLGRKGRGLLDELGYWSQANGEGDADGVDLVVGGTLSKALGGFGGIIPGSSGFVSRVRDASHYFDGASAPAAAVAGSSAKALDLILAEPGLRQSLRENTLFVRNGMRALGLTVPDGVSAHFGVSIGDAANMERIHQALKERGVLLPYVGAYSGIPAEGVMRCAVFSNHSRDQLERLLSELGSVL
jgi:7-keto-8-aminopelargonate synthetase-like enzyme